MAKNNSKRRTNIEKRRRLSELYVKGTEVRFNEDGVVDGDKNPATDDDLIVWVQPPDPLQREEAVRAGQAARARSMLAAKDPETREGVEAENFVADLTREQISDYILQNESREFRSRAIQEVLRESEWEDFTALQDSMREWEEAGFPDTEEWASLVKRDSEYGQQVKTRVQEMLEDARDGLKLISVEELRQRAKKKYTDALGNQSFMQTYEIQMLFLACRDDEDHQELFFEDPDELMKQPELVQIALADALAEFIKDPGEAKNSPRVAPGSPQSAPPSEPEISEASIPEEQSVS